MFPKGIVMCPVDNKKTWTRHCRQHCEFYINEEHHGNNHTLICGGENEGNS